MDVRWYLETHYDIAFGVKKFKMMGHTTSALFLEEIISFQNVGPIGWQPKV